MRCYPVLMHGNRKSCLRPRVDARGSDANQRAGFTLVEVLVATAVLALLVVLVAQMVSSATLVTTGSRKRMDADSQARAVFDRIAADVAGMVLRPDVDFIFSKNPGNDTVFFYSESPGFFHGNSGFEEHSPLSLVGYRVNPDSDPPLSLERLGKGLAWTGVPSGAEGGSAVFLTYPDPGPTPTASPTPFPKSTLAGNWTDTLGSPGEHTDGEDDDYHTLSSNVFRFEYCFQLKDGTFSEKPYGPTRTSPEGMTDVSAIVVAIAILDDTSRQLGSPTDQMVGALEDFSGVNLPAESQLMAARWHATVQSPGFAAASGLPEAAASAVRVYQRHFPIR